MISPLIKVKAPDLATPTAPTHTPVYPTDARINMPELWVPGKKPVGNVVIDSSHFLTKDLKFYTLFPERSSGKAIGYESFVNNSKYKFTLNDTNRWLVNRPTIQGTGSYAIGSSGNATHKIASNALPPVGISNFTIMVGYLLSGTTTSLANWKIENHLDLQIVSFTSTQVTLRHSFTGQWNIAGDTVINHSPKTQLLIAAFSFNSGVGKLYGNGKFLHTKTGSSTIGGSGTNLSLCSIPAAGNNIMFSSFWGRTLTDTEIQSLYKNPYQFLTPNRG